MTVPRTLEQIEEFAMHRGPNTLERLKKAKLYLSRSIGNPETDRAKARSLHLKIKRHIARLEERNDQEEGQEKVDSGSQQKDEGKGNSRKLSRVVKEAGIQQRDC